MTRWSTEDRNYRSVRCCMQRAEVHDWIGEDKSTELSARRTGMSFQRTRMSADRTLMSVIRTSLSLISFGFTIYQFFERLLKSGTLEAGASHAARSFGRTLVWL